jgi:hypothetical protein
MKACHSAAAAPLSCPVVQAVGVIGNLVHSSASIKRRVLEEGALQPVINLLSSSCTDSQREAALLLGQFATGGCCSCVGESVQGATAGQDQRWVGLPPRGGGGRAGARGAPRGGGGGGARPPPPPPPRPPT